MSSKTLALVVRPNRTLGAVIESSIGSLRLASVFEAAGVTSGVAPPPLPEAGPWDRLVAAVPGEDAAFRLLDLPFHDRRRAGQAVGPALEEHIPMSLDDGALAWDHAGPAGGTSVLAALVETGRLDATRERVQAAASAPAQRLLWAPCLTVAAYRRAVGAEASFVAVDIGDDGATVARLEGGVLVGLRVIAPCDNALLVRNTVWALATLAAGERRVVAGGALAEALLAAMARSAPRLTGEFLPETAPIEGFEGHDWRTMASLVGLVMAASGDAAAPMLDFEGGSGSLFGLASLRDLQGDLSPLLRWGAAAALLGVLAVGLDYVELFSQRSALVERAEAAYASAMPAGSSGGGRRVKMEMRLRELTGAAASASPGGAAGSPLGLLAALSEAVPRSLDVTLEQVDQAAAAAKVSGRAASFEVVTKMQKAIEESGAFGRVEVKDVHAAALGGGVEFTLELAPRAMGTPS